MNQKRKYFIPLCHFPTIKSKGIEKLEKQVLEKFLKDMSAESEFYCPVCKYEWCGEDYGSCPRCRKVSEFCDEDCQCPTCRGDTSSDAEIENSKLVADVRDLMANFTRQQRQELFDLGMKILDRDGPPDYYCNACDYHWTPDPYLGYCPKCRSYYCQNVLLD